MDVWLLCKRHAVTLVLGSLLLKVEAGGEVIKANTVVTVLIP